MLLLCSIRLASEVWNIFLLMLLNFKVILLRACLKSVICAASKDSLTLRQLHPFPWIPPANQSKWHYLSSTQAFSSVPENVYISSLLSRLLSSLESCLYHLARKRCAHRGYLLMSEETQLRFLITAQRVAGILQRMENRVVREFN